MREQETPNGTNGDVTVPHPREATGTLAFPGFDPGDVDAEGVDKPWSDVEGHGARFGGRDDTRKAQAAPN